MWDILNVSKSSWLRIFKLIRYWAVFEAVFHCNHLKTFPCNYLYTIDILFSEGHLFSFPVPCTLLALVNTQNICVKAYSVVYCPTILFPSLNFMMRGSRGEHFHLRIMILCVSRALRALISMTKPILIIKKSLSFFKSPQSLPLHTRVYVIAEVICSMNKWFSSKVMDGHCLLFQLFDWKLWSRYGYFKCGLFRWTTALESESCLPFPPRIALILHFLVIVV